MTSPLNEPSEDPSRHQKDRAQGSDKPRGERITHRWRRFVRNLRDLSEHPND